MPPVVKLELDLTSLMSLIFSLRGLYEPEKLQRLTRIVQFRGEESGRDVGTSGRGRATLFFLLILASQGYANLHNTVGLDRL